MKVFILLLLTLSAVTESEALIFDWLAGIVNVATDIVGGVFDWGITTVNKFVDDTFRIGSSVIGVVVDPFGWWTPTSDEHGHATGNVNKCPAILDIVFAFDTSGSMNSQKFEFAKTFAIRLTEHFQIGVNNVRFAAISFGERVQKGFDFKTYSDHNQLSTGLANTQFMGGSTRTYLALESIKQQNLFSVENGARDESSKVVVVITDGSSDSIIKTSHAAQDLHPFCDVIAIGIGAGLGVELHNIASGYNNVFTADNYNKLVLIEQRVARRLCEISAADGNIPITSEGCPGGFKKNPQNTASCTDINECTEGKSSCQQTCVDMIGGYRCKCNEGFAIDPKDTSQCLSVTECPYLMDVIFVIDASGSVGTYNFNLQLKFVANLLPHFKFGSRGARFGTRFGALLFGTNVQKLFDLNTYSSRSDCTDALLKAPYIDGGTNTHLALQYVSENEMFSPGSGGRDGAIKIIVILTDGDANDDEATETAARSLINQGTNIIAIGIGEQVNLPNLIQYVNTPKNVLGSIGFEYLDYVEESLAERSCSLAGS